MELESGNTIGRGSVVERGDPDKLSRPTSILVFEEEEMQPKDQWETAMEGFADASADAVRGLEQGCNWLTQNVEAMKIAGSTAI